jgi:hypothetical protein
MAKDVLELYANDWYAQLANIKTGTLGALALPILCLSASCSKMSILGLPSTIN